jgi:hypothetical protein
MRKLALAVLALSALAAPACAHAAAGFGDVVRLACAPGYHVDRGGNCQPDIAEQNRYCPNGTVFEPTFDGWRCDPAPREAY